MKQLLPLAILVLATGAAVAAIEPTEPLQAAGSYAAAVQNHSTSPSYVRISVSTGGAWRTTCMTANLLRGAIMREHGLGFDAQGTAQAERIALANATQHFHFSRPEAMANLPDPVTADNLALMRQRLGNFSTEALKSGLSYRGSLRPLLDGLPRELRNAAACVLIERGLSPWQADISGQLLVGGD